MFTGILNNLAILIVLIFICTQMYRFPVVNVLRMRIIEGFIFGCMTIATMASPVIIAPGVFIDSRSVIISASGLIGGPVTGVITFLVTSVYRISMGGVGTLAGLLTITNTALLGIIFNFYYKRQNVHPGLLNFFIFGVLCQLVGIPTMLLLPWDMAIKALKNIAPYMLVTFPFVSMIFLNLIYAQKEHVTTVKNLKKSEKKYRDLVALAQEGIWAIDKDDKTIFVNPRMEGMLGYAAEEMHGKKFVDFMDERGIGIYLKNLALSPRDSLAQYDVEFVRKDGGRIVTTIGMAPIKDDTGNYMGAMAGVTDVTQSLLAEQALQQHKEDLERAQEVAHIGSWTYDPKTQLPTWSKEMFRIFGMAPGIEAPSYAKHRQMIHPEDWDRFDAAVTTAVANGTGYDLEIRIIPPNGEARYVNAICEAVRTGPGETIKLVGTTQDIHERKMMEEALRESEKRYEKAEKVGNFGHWTRDLMTDKAFWSPQVYKIFGVAPDDFEPLWVNFLACVHPGDRERVREKAESSFKNGLGFEIECRVVRPDGRVRHVRASAETITNPDGKSKLLFGIVFDVTEEKELKMELDRHLLQLFRTNRLASLGEMVAGVAHEINNPNSLITFNLPLMEDIWGFFKGVINEYAKKHPDAGMGRIPIEELSQDMDDILVSMKKGSTRINQVVSKLKVFALPDDAQEVEHMDLNKIVEDTMAIFHTKLKMNEGKVYFNLGEGLPPIWGHPLKLEQVLGNLLVNASNAIAGTTNGRISITTRYIKGLHAVLVDVEDNGNGMTKDQMERIFDPFFTTRRQDGGTGLGLSISHGIVKEHHGFIGVLSRPELGSHFSVFLPVEKGEQLAVQPNLLIIDDDPSVLKMLKSNFIKLDKRFVKTLSRSELVMEYLQGHPEIDLVLSDILMPAMNGWQLLQKIRDPFPLMPVILYSGSSEALENQLDGIQPDLLIRKPFDRNRLIECINQVSRMKL